ncbi:cystathionine beta-lyase [Oleispirillum naphthae]|uniref:cystathionine beta-lyase n=1 Tax=Oleispirillum naphthae TaxID=2838853 RepID=UPI00308236A8
MKKDTLLTHAGRTSPYFSGSVNPPVYHVSTVTFPTMAAMADAQGDHLNSFYYGRIGTPTTMAFEEAVAAAEGGERTIALPSGLAAIAATLTAFTAPGDHILVSDGVYGPTRTFCQDILKKNGVAVEYFHPLAGENIAPLFKPNTRLVFCESPGSLTFEMQDIPAIAAVAHAKGALVAADCTWASPVFFRPFEKGIDISIQAATKYIVGHSDAMLGTVTTSAELYPQIKTTAVKYGYSVGAEEAYLGLRGLRSLGARMKQHQENGLAVARWLQGRPEVAHVLHPGLPDDPGHPVFARDFLGASSLFGVILEPYPEEAMVQMIDSLKLFSLGFSWGGFESLIMYTTPGIVRTTVLWNADGPTLRLHVGLEDPEDLIADLEAGFERLNAFIY